MNAIYNFDLFDAELVSVTNGATGKQVGTLKIQQSRIIATTLDGIVRVFDIQNKPLATLYLLTYKPSMYRSPRPIIATIDLFTNQK